MRAVTYFDSLFSLRGKTALVTGGATGIGRMCAQALLGAGARVLIASRKAEACEAAAAELAVFGPCEGFGGDVGSPTGVTDLARELRSRTDRLDILVNNAGTSWGADLADFPWSAWDKVLSLNVTGLFTLTRDLLPMLEAAGSAASPARVVNVGSVAGTLPISENAYSYAASKAAVHHMTRILAQELALRHVNVNAIAPGPFESRMTSFALASDAARDHAASAVPMHRLGTAEDIAGVLLFLCGRGGAYTTGAVVPVDGGMSADAPKSIWSKEA